MSMRTLKNKTKIKSASVKTLMIFFKKHSYRFFNFTVDTLFLNEHVELKKWFELQNTSVKILLNDIFSKKSY